MSRSRMLTRDLFAVANLLVLITVVRSANMEQNTDCCSSKTEVPGILDVGKTRVIPGFWTVGDILSTDFDQMLL